MDIETYRRIYKKAGNKYKAKKTMYNGRNYHSKLEAGYAMELDFMIKEGVIKGWTAQFKLDLRINNIHIANYFVDFAVELSNGKLEFHEVKGFETAIWKLKWKMALAIYGKENFVLIK